MSLTTIIKYMEVPGQTYPYRFHVGFPDQRGTSTEFQAAKAVVVQEYTDRCKELGERGHDWCVAKFYRDLYVCFVSREHAMLFKLAL